MTITGVIHSDKDIKSPYNYVRSPFQYTLDPIMVTQRENRAVSVVVDETPLTRRVCDDSANIRVM